jgi:hypothetical protein
VYHVEISAGVHRARVFNLDQEDVLEKVVRPWLDERTIAMGDRKWEPRSSSLRILEGPRMENADLSFGQGWANAARRSQDVTRTLLAQAPPPPAGPQAFVVEADSPEGLAAELAASHGGRTVQWADAERRLDGRDPEVAAVILVVRRSEPGSPRS